MLLAFLNVVAKFIRTRNDTRESTKEHPIVMEFVEGKVG
jgi:hypothetical protein